MSVLLPERKSGSDALVNCHLASLLFSAGSRTLVINQLRFGRTLNTFLEACQPLVPNPLADSGENRREKLERPNRVRVQPDGHHRTQVRLVEANRPFGTERPQPRFDLDL